MDLATHLDLGMDLQRIRDYFQHDTSSGLKRRRKIIALAVFGSANAGFTLLRQTGILRKLPDLKNPLFDANKVTTSLKAYEFGIPDGTLALSAYSLITVLAAFGGDQKLYRKSFMDKLLLIAVTANSLAALQYFSNMVLKQKKICLYCITATMTNLAMVPFAVQQVRKGE